MYKPLKCAFLMIKGKTQ